MNFSPTSVAGWMWLSARVRMDRARRAQERGASAIEWVIITAVLVALAGAIGWAIYNFVSDEADKLDVPDLPGGGGGGGGSNP